MSFQPDPSQTLFLWSLLFVYGGEEAAYNQIKPQLSDAKRDKQKFSSTNRRNELKDEGLIEIRKAGRALMVKLTDKGWAWVGGHLDYLEHLDPKTQPKAQVRPILQAVLVRLHVYLGRNQSTLADLFVDPTDTSQPSASEATATPQAQDVQTRIRAAYRQLSGGESLARVRLSDLRTTLADVPRDELDATLIEMSRARALHLEESANPRDLTSKDQKAALKLGGDLSYFLRME